MDPLPSQDPAFKSDSDATLVTAPEDIRRQSSVKRLLDVYEQARTEYLSVANKGDSTTVNAAKFLRDTVENVIDNLKSTDLEADKQAELRTMARMAKDAVEKLCGGKKRKFDDNTDQSRSRSASRTKSVTLADRSRQEDARRRSTLGGDRYRDRYDRPARELFRHRDRDYRERSPVRIPYGYSRPVDTYYPA
jgi:hypothetical protein